LIILIILGEERKNSNKHRENLLQCHFIHCESYIKSPEIVRKTSWWEVRALVPPQVDMYFSSEMMWGFSWGLRIYSILSRICCFWCNNYPGKYCGM
jgi:hypothetical protein